MGISKETLADQVYTILKDEILHEVIKGGTKITLKQLQDKFNLSTTPLREAMNRLTQEGLLIHTTNIGAKVIDLTSKDVIELYQMSKTLEITAMELAYKSNKDMLIDVMKQSINHQQEAISQRDIESFHQTSDDFHDLFFQLANNSRLYESAKRYRNQISILVNRYQNHPDMFLYVFEEHKSIYEAIEHHDLFKAKSLFELHLSHGQDYMMLQLHK